MRTPIKNHGVRRPTRSHRLYLLNSFWRKQKIHTIKENVQHNNVFDFITMQSFGITTLTLTRTLKFTKRVGW